MLVTEKRTEAILNGYIRDGSCRVEVCADYGEPGYRLEVESNQIAFANWNDISENVQKYLGLIGYELQWSDEWMISYETDKCYRAEPDSYAWTPYYYITEDGEIIGGDEVENQPDNAMAYVEDYLLNDAKRINTFEICNILKEMGFELHNPEPYESGFYGKDDSPKEIGKALKEAGRDYVFSGLSKSQFCINYDVWTRPKTQ
jgi:hypothetical protein